MNKSILNPTDVIDHAKEGEYIHAIAQRNFCIIDMNKKITDSINSAIERGVNEIKLIGGGFPIGLENEDSIEYSSVLENYFTNPDWKDIVELRVRNKFSSVPSNNICWCGKTKYLEYSYTPCNEYIVFGRWVLIEGFNEILDRFKKSFNKISKESVKLGYKTKKNLLVEMNGMFRYPTDEEYTEFENLINKN